MEKTIWKTKEYKEAKQQAIKEGKIKSKCEWCNSTECLTPHHEISFRQLYYFELRRLQIVKMSKEQNFTFPPCALTKTGGFSTSKGYLKVGVFKNFLQENPELREEANKIATEKYLFFEDIITLCQRCHFAVHKGMMLCPYCKKAYYKIDFPSCLNKLCRKKSEKDFEDVGKDF